MKTYNELCGYGLFIDDVFGGAVEDASNGHRASDYWLDLKVFYARSIIHSVVIL